MSSPSNQGTLNLRLLTVEGKPISDSNGHLEIITLQPNLKEKVIFSKPVTFPLDPISLPAFPQIKETFCRVTTTRFREADTKFFKVLDSEVTDLPVKLLRKPDQWQPDFPPFDELPSGFDRLKEVLERSPELKVRNGEGLALFVGPKYDQISQSSDERTRSAKLGLLNLYTKMSNLLEPAENKVNWFSFVDEILEIAQSRMIALVRPEMGQKVLDISQDFDKFDDYKPTPSENHFGNMPVRFGVEKGEMFSVKTRDRKGNLQLTFGPGRSNGKDVLVLDADIDESGTLLAHLLDVLRHRITHQQTHPFDVHEFIANELHEAAQPNNNIPLGYNLV
ncbi:MAG TPA: hypothetical protein VF131_25940 [Blastocatellia bacterium]|nr:hypothetical protein [Blastocatellia bacterium]